MDSQVLVNVLKVNSIAWVIRSYQHVKQIKPKRKS